MLFISALPDTDFFVWQIEVQLYNFKNHGIEKEKIQILIGYNQDKGLNINFIQLAADYSDFATFFFYPDRRISNAYLSSIRPHLLKQHFRAFPHLKHEVLFFHDSDIVFTHSLPDIKRYTAGKEWYVSDTRSYIGLNYLNEFGNQCVNKMREIVGINLNTLKKNDVNAGGAQYVIKEVDFDFWDKCETQCEELYKFLISAASNQEARNYKIRPKSEIQAWCADMWVILWNGFKRSKVLIDSGLGFCWPHQPQAYWKNNTIFHNAGVVNSQKQLLFYKFDFTETSPFYKFFEAEKLAYCSKNYIEIIKNVEKSRRFNATDVNFIIIIRICSPEEIEQLNAAIQFISAYFETKISIFEISGTSKIPRNKTKFSSIKYYLLNRKDIATWFQRLDRAVRISQSDIIVNYDINATIAPDQIYKSIISIRHGSSSFSHPYNKTLDFNGDNYKHYIRPTIRIEMFFKYINSMRALEKETIERFIVFKRASFIDLQREGVQWHPLEKQFEFFNKLYSLGYKYDRQPGPLFLIKQNPLE